MRIKLLIIMITFSVSLFGQSKTGSTAAPFLNIGIGPRSIAMGGAFVATADDVSSIYWNPAGAARMNKSGALFAHSKWFADIDYNWAGTVVNMDDAGVIGISVTNLDYGDMELTTLSEPEGTGGTFTANDMSIAITYAKNLTDRFSIGGSVKYISQNIWNSSASTIAVDLGVLFHSDIYGLRIGAAITNLGGDMQISGSDLNIQHDIDRTIYGNNDQILATLDTDKWPLPLTFKIGLAMELIEMRDHRVTIAADALNPSDNDQAMNVGMEYEVFNMIALRAGYKSLFLDNSEEGLTLGFGLKYDFTPSLGLSIDYAYQQFGVLKDTQHFSVGVFF
ncbi:MAG: PorV/PorQ family protein [Melioribacteraceae bacterium]|nr:PorV/PorQ family protein [Melioribacteraceae bacterium]